MNNQQDKSRKVTNSKPIPHIPLLFKEVIADVLKVKPPEKLQLQATRKERLKKSKQK